MMKLRKLFSWRLVKAEVKVEVEITEEVKVEVIPTVVHGAAHIPILPTLGQGQDLILTPDQDHTHPIHQDPDQDHPQFNDEEVLQVSLIKEG